MLVNNPLKIKRKEIGYSQEDIAKILHISRQQENKLEQGKAKPSCTVLLDMILLLHIEPLYLHMYYRELD